MLARDSESFTQGELLNGWSTCLKTIEFHPQSNPCLTSIQQHYLPEAYAGTEDPVPGVQ